MRTSAFALALLAFGLPVAAQAATALDYNIVVSGSFTSSSSDTEGRIAAGGDVNISNYAVGNKASGGYSVVAGGAFTGNSGSTAGGVMASSINASSFGFGGSNATYSAKSSPIAIASEMARLSALSQDLYSNAANYGTVGATTMVYGSQLQVTGSSSGVNIFNVTGDQLSAATGGINIFVPTGSIVVFNVSGISDAIPNTGASNGSNYYSANTASDILFNFYQATSLSATAVYGSILAPKADISTGWGAIDGQIFAKSYSGNAQINYDPLAAPNGSVNLLSRTVVTSSAVTAVPEPASWGMMILGFGVVGGALRHQRRGRRQIA